MVRKLVNKGLKPSVLMKGPGYRWLEPLVLRVAFRKWS